MTILAAIDGERRPDPVVETAHDLSVAYGDDLVVLHVTDDGDFAARQDASAVDGRVSYFLDHAVSDAEKVAAAVVEETLDGDDHGVTVEGEVGDPAELVLARAKRLDARYVVIGGRKRTPVGKALFGSLTQAILLHADRPVVTAMTGE